jgi:DNA-directed RNA polymerase sigma subunit (sigma70/sigma32)
MPKIVIRFSKENLNKINTTLNLIQNDGLVLSETDKDDFIDFLKTEYKLIRHISENDVVDCYLLAAEFVFSNNSALEFMSEEMKSEVSKHARDYILKRQNQTSLSNSIDYWFNEVNKEMIKTLDFNNDDFEIIPENRDVFIRKNLRLVINCAKRYRYIGIPFEDLIQTGNIGLIKAYDSYNGERSKIRSLVIKKIELSPKESWTAEEASAILNENFKYTNSITKIIFENIPEYGFYTKNEFISWCKEHIKAASLPSVSFIMIRSEILMSLNDSRQVNIPYKKLANGYTNFISLNSDSPSTGCNTENSLMFDKSKEDFFINDDGSISEEDQETVHQLLEKYIAEFLDPQEQYILNEYFGFNSEDGKCDIKELVSKTGMSKRLLTKTIKALTQKIYNQIPQDEKNYIKELL